MCIRDRHNRSKNRTGIVNQLKNNKKTRKKLNLKIITIQKFNKIPLHLPLLVKQVASAINVAQPSTPINNAVNSSTNLHYVSIVLRKGTLQGNVQKMRKVYIVKEVHVLAVAQLGTRLRIAQ